MQKDKFIILMSENDQSKAIGDFFRECGYELSTHFDIRQYEDYVFIVNDFLLTIKNIPRVYTSKMFGFKGDVRGSFESEFLENSEIRKLLLGYFNFNCKFDLIEQYSLNYQNSYNFKIHDYLNLGYFIDEISGKAYANQFDFENIRDYLNLVMPKMLKLAESKIGQLLLEVVFSFNNKGFVIHIDSTIPEFDLEEDYLNHSFGLKNPDSYPHFYNLNYSIKRNKLSTTALWCKSPDILGFKGSFINGHSKRGNESFLQSKSLIDTVTDRVIYTRNHQDNTLEEVQLEKDQNLKLTTRENFDEKSIEVFENNIKDKIEIELQAVRMQNTKIKKAMQIMKGEFEKNHQKSVKFDKIIKELNFKHEKSEEESNKLIIELRTQLATFDSDKFENGQQMKNTVLKLNKDLHLCQTLIKKMKIESFELKKKYEDLEKNAQKAEVKPVILTENKFEKLDREQELHQIEIKKMEEDNRLIRLELKKVQQKLKFALGQIEEAQKSNKVTVTNKGNEVHQKQLETITERMSALSNELSEKKKEVIKFKKDQSSLLRKIDELEKKIVDSEKKVA